MSFVQGTNVYSTIQNWKIFFFINSTTTSSDDTFLWGRVRTLMCRTGKCLNPARARLSTLTNNDYSDVLLALPESDGN